MKNLIAFLVLAFLGTLTGPTLLAQDEEYGMASYYHDDFQGRETAYGIPYDKNQLTAAHKKHPLGTILRVTRLDNKRSVNVKVTDKGPFIKGRVVDLSRAAAEKLGLVSDGTAEVRVELVSLPGREGVVSTEPARVIDTEPIRPADYGTDNTPERPATRPATTPPATTTKPAVSTSPATATAAAEPATRPTSTTRQETAPSRAKLVGKDYAQYGLYEIELRRPKQAGYGVQIALLTNYENVLKEVADLQAKWFDNIMVSIEPGSSGKTNYRIILGPFTTEGAAQNYVKNLRQKYKMKGFSVNLEDLQYSGKP